MKIEFDCVRDSRYGQNIVQLHRRRSLDFEKIGCESSSGTVSPYKRIIDERDHMGAKYVTSCDTDLWKDRLRYLASYDPVIILYPLMSNTFYCGGIPCEYHN